MVPSSQVFVTLGAGVVFGEISILEIPGSKMGNRRSANIRSVGYTDLFALHKDDLWDALNEYPEARRQLLEKGTAMLMKDNMIDEEKAKAEAAAQEELHEKLDRLDGNMDGLNDQLNQMLADYSLFHVNVKKRVAFLEDDKNITG